MADSSHTLTPKQHLWRAAIEIGFIMFLFYANLLMGEYSRHYSPAPSFAFAVWDIFTLANFAIGFVAACIGYGVGEFLRRKL